MVAKRFAIGFAVAILFPLLVHYGVSSLVHNPRWQEYHDAGAYPRERSPEEQEKFRAQQEEQDRKFRAQQERFQAALFYVAVPLGLAAVVAGAFLGFQAVGAGLMFGGVFAMINGYYGYWRSMSDQVKFLSLLAAFGAIVFVGYKKLNPGPAGGEGRPPQSPPPAAEKPAPNPPPRRVPLSEKVPHLDDLEP